MLRAWSARRMACFRLNPVLLWQPSIVTMRLVSKCRRTRSCVIPRSMNLRSPRRRRRRGRIERECVREREGQRGTDRETDPSSAQSFLTSTFTLLGAIYTCYLLRVQHSTKATSDTPVAKRKQIQHQISPTVSQFELPLLQTALDRAGCASLVEQISSRLWSPSRRDKASAPLVPLAST